VSDSDSSSNSASDSEKSEVETRVPQTERPTTVDVQSSLAPEGNEEEEEIIFTSSRPYARFLSYFSICTTYIVYIHSPIPKLNPGPLPVPYITRLKPVSGSSKRKSQESSLASRLISIRDPELEKLEKATAFLDGPAPPIPPPELTKSGKPLTKKQRKEVCF